MYHRIQNLNYVIFRITKKKFQSETNFFSVRKSTSKFRDLTMPRTYMLNFQLCRTDLNDSSFERTFYADYFIKKNQMSKIASSWSFEPLKSDKLVKYGTKIERVIAEIT